MATTVTSSPDLRPQVMKRIEKLSDSSLAEVERFLMQLEAESLMDSVCGAMDEARDAGQMGDVENSLREYRQRRPYR